MLAACRLTRSANAATFAHLLFHFCCNHARCFLISIYSSTTAALQGAALLAAGSELLLEIVNPGIIGGVVLPVLGALPDSLIILSSLSASQAEAQEALAVGVGERCSTGLGERQQQCDLSQLAVHGGDVWGSAAASPHGTDHCTWTCSRMTMKCCVAPYTVQQQWW